MVNQRLQIQRWDSNLLGPKTATAHSCQISTAETMVREQREAKQFHMREIESSSYRKRQSLLGFQILYVRRLLRALKIRS